MKDKALFNLTNDVRALIYHFTDIQEAAHLHSQLLHLPYRDKTNTTRSIDTTRGTKQNNFRIQQIGCQLYQC